MATEINSRNFDEVIQRRVLARLKRMDPREGKIRSTLFRIGNQIVAESTLNITRPIPPKRHKNNFAGGGVKNLVDSGRLLGSLKQLPIRTSGGTSELTVGVFGVKYAAIHEFGDVIEPKRGKFMAIPLTEEFRGKQPRNEQELFYFRKRGGVPFLVKEINGRLQFAYRLVEEVEVPPRPYFFPAVRKVTPKAINMIRNLFLGKK